jgi:hypothetical protein
VNQTRWTAVVACVVFALASARGWAETKSGFLWNPFAKNPDSTTASSGFKLPSLWPASEEKPVNRRPTEPSAWDKFSGETKAMWDKTTDTLTFWDNGKKSSKKPPSSVRSRYGLTRKEEKKYFWSDWFSGQEEESQRPRTVSEFLNQEKPLP